MAFLAVAVVVSLDWHLCRTLILPIHKTFVYASSLVALVFCDLDIRFKVSHLVDIELTH